MLFRDLVAFFISVILVIRLLDKFLRKEDANYVRR
jgi:hypothetical protein